VYIHIGGAYSVSDAYIVGIFDFDGTTAKRSATVSFLRQAEKENRVEVISPDLPRSFIVTLDRTYYSPISAATLRRRMKRDHLARQEHSWLKSEPVSDETDEEPIARKVKK
jgi:thymidylate kinase